MPAKWYARLAVYPVKYTINACKFLLPACLPSVGYANTIKSNKMNKFDEHTRSHSNWHSPIGFICKLHRI